jgi:hypothetical protein
MVPQTTFPQTTVPQTTFPKKWDPTLLGHLLALGDEPRLG